MDFSYDMLIEHIKQNRELHFYYCNKQYSISNNKNGWYLTEFNNPVYQTCDDGETLIKYGKIEGNFLKDIWDDIEIEVVF